MPQPLKKIDENLHPDADQVKRDVPIHRLFGRPLSDLKCCHSPLRNDDSPSFSVFYSAKHGHELAKDFSTGQMYDAVKLYAAIKGTTYDQACVALANFDGRPIADVQPGVRKNEKKGKSGGTESGKSGDQPDADNVAVPSGRPLQEAGYLVRKQLTFPRWAAAQLGAYRDKNGNLCFQSVSGSIHVKGGAVTTSTGKKTSFATWRNGGGTYSACGN